jgi:ATP-dependent Clp protease ATP-binding subunit ClpA
MGARPMARLIQEQIKRPLAEELLFGKLANGGTVRVGVLADGSALKLDCEPTATPELTAANDVAE